MLPKIKKHKKQLAVSLKNKRLLFVKRTGKRDTHYKKDASLNYNNNYKNKKKLGDKKNYKKKSNMKSNKNIRQTNLSCENWKY